MENCNMFSEPVMVTVADSHAHERHPYCNKVLAMQSSQKQDLMPVLNWVLRPIPGISTVNMDFASRSTTFHGKTLSISEIRK